MVAVNDTDLLFRKATIDDALFISRGFHTAMLWEDVPEERILRFAENVCSRTDVLYSYVNTIIVEKTNETGETAPVGMATAYDGRFYHELRVRTMDIIKELFGTEFPGMEDEAEPGEYYIDTLAVVPSCRKKGIGQALIRKCIENGRLLGIPHVTLAVDPVNIKAQRLYASLGFVRAKNLFIFGHTYWKMERSF